MEYGDMDKLQEQREKSFKALKAIQHIGDAYHEITQSIWNICGNLNCRLSEEEMNLIIKAQKNLGSGFSFLLDYLEEAGIIEKEK